MTLHDNDFHIKKARELHKYIEEALTFTDYKWDNEPARKLRLRLSYIQGFLEGWFYPDLEDLK